MASSIRWFCLMAAVLTLGCADQKPEAAQRHPGDDVLRDPMGYKPSMDDPNISGGGLLHYDHKAMKHDIDILTNP